jgi:hypothetical protein
VWQHAPSANIAPAPFNALRVNDALSFEAGYRTENTTAPADPLMANGHDESGIPDATREPSWPPQPRMAPVRQTSVS